MLGKLFDLLKLDDKALGMIFRMGLSVTIAIVGVYFLSAPIIEPVAAKMFKEMLVAQGVDPLIFKQLQTQSTDNSKDIDELKRDSNAIRTELNTVKQQVEKVADKVEQGTKTVEKVEDLVKKLLELQLQRSGQVQ